MRVDGFRAEEDHGTKLWAAKLTLSQDFHALYERTYGKGTAWKDVPALMVNYTVKVTGRLDRPALGGGLAGGPSATGLAREHREVFLPGEREFRRIPIIDDASVVLRGRVEGPAIVDATDTTIYVPPGAVLERDTYANFVLTR